jgi:hypothetical protein
MSIELPKYFPTLYGCDGVIIYPACPVLLLKTQKSIPDNKETPDADQEFTKIEIKQFTTVKY